MQALPQLLWLRCLKSTIDYSPLIVEPETLLSDAISLMAQWGVNVLVMSVSQLVGWFTAQDVVRLLAAGADFKTTKISEVMQTSAIALKLSDFNNMTTVLALFQQHQLDLLPIVDEQGQPLGTVTPESICRSLEQPIEATTGECSKGELVSAMEDCFRQIDKHYCRLLDTGIATLISEEKVDCIDSNEEKHVQASLPQSNEKLQRLSQQTIALQAINQKLLTEISDRQIIEKQLQQSQQVLQLIIDTIPQCIFWKDRNSVFLGCNRNFAKMVGFESPADIVGKTDYDLPCKQEDADFYRECDARVIQTNTPEYHIIEPLLKADDKQVWLETTKVPLHDGEGNVVGILGTFEDITERKQVQDALKKSEERFRFLAESIPQQVWIAEANGNIEYVNQRTLDYFACTQEELLGWEWQKWIHPEDWPRCLDCWQTSLVTGTPYEIEFRWQRAADKSYRWHLARALPLRDRHGKIINWFGTNTDIHERVSAETALRESERRYQTIASVSPVGIFCTDAEGNCLYVNERWCEIAGLTKAAGIGRSWIAAIHPQDRERVASEWNQAVTGKRPFRLEYRYQRPDGGVTWVFGQAVAELTDIGEVNAYVGTIADISQQQAALHELRQTEAALRHSEERFRNLVEASSDWVWEVDENATYTYVSPKVRDILGYEPQAVLGKTAFELMPPEEAERVCQVFTQIAATQQPFTCLENINIHQDGRLVVLETSGVPVFDVAGKFRGYRGIDRDITTRKHSEIALLASQQRLQYLLSSSPAVIYTAKTSEDFGGTFVSENVSAMLGYKAQETIEDSRFWASHIHPEDAPYVLAKLAKIPQHGQYQLEYRFLHKDGTYRWLYDQGKLVRDETGNPLELVGYMADITNRKQLEQELRLSLEKEKELSELKSRFVAMTSHEFRTPLSTILSSSELLEHYRHNWSEEKQLIHLHRIQTAVKRMTEMLNDILIVGKVEAGKLEFRPKSFDLVAYCRHLTEETRLNFSNQQVTEFISQYESMPCYMDDKLLGHILGNLLSNAIKYSPVNSTIKFTLTCQQGQAIFKIQDWGIGIPPEDLPHLFESFYRAHNVGNILGTGLGLAIVKRCVDIHKGEIFVTSTLGVSTLFTVILPLNKQI
ncbi:PAS domain S-box protein [Nostocaceae cyanobacterium CENA369]|uniref:histidine kinase n=1 Tax=Dendronalium phyllosphericum CENA369 TaxID=1725256 RepID=A0A8J7LHV7_9NOST|nr:PAS domain S-box protein [Dendronalium phyllosphericum]MBH8574449.1 PAS domain S-box protein [Dendronalium phyllosphericum CENA369]